MKKNNYNNNVCYNNYVYCALDTNLEDELTVQHAVGSSCMRHAYVCLIEDKSRFSCEQSGVDDPNFAYDLLTELTRTFLAYADDVRAQDSAAYAIQVHTRDLLTLDAVCVCVCVFFWLVSAMCICCRCPIGAAVHL